MHIHALTWAGNICMHICAYTVSQTECPSTENIIHAYMFKYMHILAYTCIYCVCSYMIIYIDHDAIFVHILAYTCIYCQQQLYGIFKFLHVYAYVYARICTYIVTYMQVNARICNYMDRLATFRKKNTCIYVQYVHIRATYVTTYVHIRTFKIQLYLHINHTVYASICTYCMYVC